MKIPELIKFTRTKLGENQTEFAKRFFYDASFISHVEAGRREAPYKIIHFCMDFIETYTVCDKCSGKGFI